MRKHLTDPEWESQQDREADLALRRLVGGDASDEMHRAAGRQFERVQAQLRRGEETPPRGAASARTFRLIPLVAAVLILVGGWFFFVYSPKLTWAEVRSTFRQVPFFSASIYITRDPAKPSEHVELWMARDGRLRLHQGGRVFLANKGKLLGVWDAASKKRIDITVLTELQRRDLHMDEALALVDLFADMNAFSIDALLAHFCGRQTISPPLPNAEPSVSRGIEAFDVTNDANPEWMRVWVLKEAGLPVRFRWWDPRDGECSEMLFDYMREQPAEAFDPDALAAAMLARPAHKNPLYALLLEPGGQLLTPEDLFEANGYHMPEVIEAGRTGDGIVWIKSGKSENRTPQGVTFYGFGRINDDLGQEYLRHSMTHQTGENVGIECFIPLDYRDGYRKPSRYELTCWSQPEIRTVAGDVVGSVTLTEWKEETPPPAPLGAGPQDQAAVKAVITEWVCRENWEHVDRLLATIPGEAQDNAMALYREETRLDKWSLMGRDDEVLALAKSLHEILTQVSQADALQHPKVVEEYVKQLVKRNQLEQAQRVLAPYRDVFQTAEDMTTASRIFLELIRQCRDALLDQQKIDALFGFSAWSLPRVQDYFKMFPQSGITVESDPRYDPWRAYVRDVAKRYEGHTLPQAVDFPNVTPFDTDKPACDVSLPGVDGYRIAPLRGTWETLAQSLARARDVDPDLARVTPGLQGTRVEGLAVFPESVGYKAALTAFCARNGVRVEERSVSRSVWVARYDGRPLPCWRYVRPLTAEELGSEPVCRVGGRTMTARSVLDYFAMAINQGNPGEKVVIVDETGLPSVPGENQSWGSICLSYSNAFGTGDVATQKAKDWFRDNFGITFSREVRPFSALTLSPNS
ncbi:MAG: hypothetical protein HZB26_19650 [Candidatus Hydrogenedentes bacterium]|nr:hypothetical protein [Candidatus Hydrogenedentota bacterium]